jgi:hypothetical protein
MILSNRLFGKKRIQYIGTANNHVDSTNFSVSLAGIPFWPGDLGILFVAADDLDATFTVTGWTELVASNGAYNREHSVWVRTLQAGDSSVASVNFSADKTIATVCVFRSASVIAGDCALDGRAGGSSPNTPDPPIASVSNVDIDDYVLVLVIHDYTTASITGLTDYTTIYTGAHAGGFCTVGAFYRTRVSGQPNPGSVTGTNFLESTWAAHTIILRNT